MPKIEDLTIDNKELWDIAVGMITDTHHDLSIFAQYFGISEKKVKKFVDENPAFRKAVEERDALLRFKMHQTYLEFALGKKYTEEVEDENGNTVTVETDEYDIEPNLNALKHQIAVRSNWIFGDKPLPNTKKEDSPLERMDAAFSEWLKEHPELIEELLPHEETQEPQKKTTKKKVNKNAKGNAQSSSGNEYDFQNKGENISSLCEKKAI